MEGRRRDLGEKKELESVEHPVLEEVGGDTGLLPKWESRGPEKEPQRA